MPRIRIDDHLIIPFGRPKWDMSKIRIAGVSTRASYLVSDTPCAYINVRDKRPLRLGDFPELFPDDFKYGLNSNEALEFIKNHLKTYCELQTKFEQLFLEAYFEYCVSAVTPSPFLLRHSTRDKLRWPYNHPDAVFEALLPLPQAHLYLQDPLDEVETFVPRNMVKVDFAFWDGERLTAVEVDGSSHAGSEAHVRKDRMLSRSGVNALHVLNGELVQHRTRVISALLPESVTRFWKGVERPSGNPLEFELPFDLPFD